MSNPPSFFSELQRRHVYNWQNASDRSTLAQIEALVSDRDAAFANLDLLAAEPSAVSIGDLRFNPIWDNLRSDPRFEKLIAKHRSE